MRTRVTRETLERALTERRPFVPDIEGPDLVDGLLTRWANESSRWCADAFREVTIGSTVAPNGLRPSRANVNLWRQRLRALTNA